MTMDLDLDGFRPVYVIPRLSQGIPMSGFYSLLPFWGRRGVIGRVVPRGRLLDAIYSLPLADKALVSADSRLDLEGVASEGIDAALGVPDICLQVAACVKSCADFAFPFEVVLIAHEETAVVHVRRDKARDGDQHERKAPPGNARWGAGGPSKAQSQHSPSRSATIIQS